MPSGPNPQKKKHANRKYGIPYNGKQGKFCFSRRHHLPVAEPESTIKTLFGHNQNMGAAWIYDERNTAQRPQKWHKKYKIRRVPKVVVLSSYINWFEQWDACVFMFPRDVLGTSMCNPGSRFGNYYYMDQYNVRPDDTDFDTMIQGDQYDRVVALVNNPMQKLHNDLQETFLEVQEQLLKDKNDPIYTVIPQWCPPSLGMKGANYTLTNWEYSGREWWDNSAPMYNFYPYDAYFEYPDVDSPDNELEFGFQGVPCLMAPPPGFGTNCLHIYCGHWTYKAFPAPSPFTYESWPSGPPGLLIGGVYLGNYLGAAVQLLDGRRQIWQDCGLGFGYMNGAGGLLNYYSEILNGAASDYKSNFYKYRDLGVRLFNFDVDFNFGWNPAAIWQDQKEYLEGRFYFGWDTCCEFIGCNEDHSCEDAPDGELKFGKHTFKDPDSPSLRDAIDIWFPPIQERIEKYYGTLKQGSQDFFEGMIQNKNLATEYNVKFEGGAKQLVNPSKLIEYIKNYFAERKKKGW